MIQENEQKLRELKRSEWEAIYDNEAMRLERIRPFSKQLKEPYYTHLWILKQLKDIDRFSSIIEIGSGIGALAHHIKQLGFNNMVSCDISQVSVKLSSKNVPDVQFLHHDIQDALHKKADIIVSNQTLEHVLDIDRAFSNMIKCSKKYIFFTIPIEDRLNGHNNSAKHIHNYDFYQLYNWLSSFKALKSFKIFYINKVKRIESSTGDPALKNVFGVRCEVKNE